MTDAADKMAQTIARHCGRGEPVLDDYRAVALAAFRDNERLRSEVAKWRAAYNASRENEERLRGLLREVFDTDMSEGGLIEPDLFQRIEAALGATVQPCACGRKVGEPHRVDCGHSSREGGDTVQPQAIHPGDALYAAERDFIEATADKSGAAHD
jgi:hypothetical protein